MTAMLSREIPNTTHRPTNKESQRVYAIAFDMDTTTMQSTYPGPSYQNGYEEIRKILAKFHFTRQQGSVYFGDPAKVNAVTCVLAVQALVQQLPWFAASVSDLRMLRIEEQNDLMPAVTALG